MAGEQNSEPARRRFWSDPVVQFIAAGLLAMALVVIGASWFGDRAATREAVDNARANTELLARAVVAPGIPRGLLTGEAAALDRFDRLIRQRVLSDDVVRIKVWDGTGSIVYSDETRVIGQQFDLDEEELSILADGGSDAEVSDLSEPENRYERQFGELVEVYTRVQDPDGTPLLLEAYYPADRIEERSDDVIAAFRPITVAGLALFLLITVPIVWLLARRLDAAAAGRERLLTAAVEASDIERRRIARDLHDGVVQDLAGASFELSATARELDGQPELAAVLDDLGAGVRQSLRSLRSLLVEIYPPELRTAGLAAALDDLVASPIAAGVDVRLDVADTTGVADDTVALVWRVAQESVRNAVRHGRPSRLELTVGVSDDAVTLDVVDDGAGFDTEAPPPTGSLGLRGIRDLVDESGATLAVTSQPGSGTALHLRVPRP